MNYFLPNVSLIIDHPNCDLPWIHNSEIFSIEGKWEVNEYSDTYSPRTRRLFFLKHPQVNSLTRLLGEQGTYSLHRVILSFFDASVKLNDFIDAYYENIKQNKLTLAELESQAKQYSINKFNYNSIEVPTFLCEYDSKLFRVKEHYKAYPNELLESLFSMNVNNILINHGVTPYKNLSEGAFFNTKEHDKTITKMLTHREIGMVMHTWRKLNNYSSIDFIANVSKILEFIRADLIKNEDKFGNSEDHFIKLEKLIKLVSDKERRLFFGMFNDAERLGFISRHGTSVDKKKLQEEMHLIDYISISDKEPNTVAEIRESMMKDHIIPNASELAYVYDFWHYTTSLIVTLWFVSRRTML
ncbi:hypothetical protein BLL40_15155 [Domibacillus mangrovi]|uniref:Uncharacterized protein n=1 Tax=Domibacillus mangrovi TaxID=1714354 RepID=A0A1Q5NZQ3_9BACI|nr:hypothetical protein [Domibacillus mangrovi]OKL35494.1 hypothetical protein BLL40_15155 [Domibacillus mangrovi]